MSGPALQVLARARWPEPEDGELPRIAGFVVSSFNPLVVECAERCLRAWYGEPPVAGSPRVAVLLVSASGDLGTARAIEEAVAAGRRVPPLLFFQSNPNAVLGHVAARWGLTGPVLALGAVLGPPLGPVLEPVPGSSPAGLAEAALLLADGDADLVLLITAEQAEQPGERDRAGALLPGPA
ncbi:hypothetical protein GCM10009665_56280 [Kitasatospora nipponensis]|uniref:Beta-ketoacyl synthase-like protein n=1 Tax=Kitasatospora nipponensis TaxID=258049 RepID=A0ABP4HCJ1_9ACTN